MLKKGKSGITLISLVITIIILLILATVAITLAVDSDGLFRKAEEATDKWNTSLENEEEIIDLINPVSSYVIEQSTGRRVPIPKGYVASQIPEESTIAGGLVIYEGTEEVIGTKGSIEHETAMTTRNQYVWVPVDDINDMVMCKSNAGGSVCSLLQEENGDLKCTTHNSKDLVGRLYALEDSEVGMTPTMGPGEIPYLVMSYNMDFTKTNQIYPVDSVDYYEPGIVEGEDTTLLAQLKKEFEDMAKSVAKYGGFYISRYEIGQNGTSQKGQEVLSNEGAIDWYVLRDTTSKSGTYITSQMIWGSQYDQLIKFLAEDVDNSPMLREFRYKFFI